MTDCTLKKALEKCPNFIFGKADCMECKEVICCLVHAKKCFLYCPAEMHQNIADEIKKEYNHSTVPAVFIDGKFIGGHTALQKHMQQNK